MSFEETKMDLMTGVVLRVLKNGKSIDPYEEMQKLPSVRVFVIFWEDIGEIRIYCSCSLCDLCSSSQRLLNEIMFKKSEDESFLAAVSSRERFLTVDDAVGVYFYLNDLMLIQRSKIPRTYVSLN